MQYTPKKLQILAPAGSVEQLVCAVNNGCDAVYLGLDSFNARMKAPNFTLHNLAEWVNYCHLFGVKVYVTINTSLKNDEFVKALELLHSVYLQNADGVIVTDISLLRIAASLPKPFEVVASTQLNIHDNYGAEFLKKCGATTVVCARECSYEDIGKIASTGINVECFLHGAMCVSQSGQCLFSSMVGGNSGNRGLCAQPCRKYYSVDGKVNAGGYLLSARDMCSLDNAVELVNAGATTFKIEGRNRRPEYAGVASRIYRKLFENKFEYNNSDYDILAEMFNRGMARNGYLLGGNSEIIYPTLQNHSGVAVGYICNGKVVSSQKLSKGDGLKVFDGDKEVCGGVVLESGMGTVNSKFAGKVSDGMRVHRTTSIELCDKATSAKRRLNVSIEFIANAGDFAEITAHCLGLFVSIKSDFVVQKAFNRSTLRGEIAEQLQKTGNTHYTITDIVINIGEIFIAKSQINALRRAVLDELTKKLQNKYDAQFLNRKSTDLRDLIKLNDNRKKSATKFAACAVVCYDELQLRRAQPVADYLIYKPNSIDLAAFSIAAKYGAFVDLPPFSSANYVSDLLDKVSAKLVCNNVGQVEIARRHDVEYIAGSGLNIFNDYMAAEFADSQTFVYSKELTLSEISAFDDKSGLIFVDGAIGLMQLCHCPYKVVYACDCAKCKADSNLIYLDEFKNRFYIHRRKVDRCTFELINGKKMSVACKLSSKGRYLMDFDEKVLQHYIRLNNGENDGYTELQPYTKGRLYSKIN